MPAAPTAAGGDESRPKVLYVMGAGRSGSSILGVALGNFDGVFFAGELNKWLPRRGTPSFADPERERFWLGVHERMPDASDLHGGATSALERSSLLLRPRAIAARRRLRRRYRAIAEDLYRAIAAESGTATIVDTSHYPLRARELQALTGIDFHLLLLVRDPQAVVASLARTDVVERSFGALAANAYLLLTHALSVWVFLKQPRERRLCVRYEDLRAEPERVLTEILARAGVGAAAPDLAALATGVPLHGNRLVNAKSVSFERGSERLARRSALTAALQLPARAVLGRLRPSTREAAGS